MVGHYQKLLEGIVANPDAPISKLPLLTEAEVSFMPIIEKEFMELTQALDVAAFWTENELCQDFTTKKPRCSVSFAPDDHWIFEFMQVPSTLRYYE